MSLLFSFGCHMQVLKCFPFFCINYTAKQWKRMVTKATFVGPGFTRKPPKYERFIRPSGLRFTKAHVTHPELRCTFCLEIIGIKKNPNGPMYTSLGVMTRGTIIEVSSTTKIHILGSLFCHICWRLELVSRSMWVSLVLLHQLEKLSGVSEQILRTLYKILSVIAVFYTSICFGLQGSTLRWQTIQRMTDV